MTGAQSYMTLLFFWWRHELVTLIPPALRHRMTQPFGFLSAYVVGNRLVVSDAHPGGQDRIDIDLAALSAPGLAAQYRKRLRQMSSLKPLVIDPGTQNTLVRRMILPAAALGNLQEVIGFELDWRTPFRTETIVYAYRVITIDLWTRKLEVEVTVVPRHAIAEVQTALRTLGQGETAVRADSQLIPPEDEATRTATLRRTVGVLGAMALVLAAVWIYLPLHDKAKRLAALEAAIEEARSDAHAAADQNAAINALAERANTLVELKRTTRSASQTITALSHNLPKQVDLLEFSYSDTRLTLAGYAKKPLSVIERLESAPAFDGVSFASPVVDAASGKTKRFRLTAEVSRR